MLVVLCCVVYFVIDSGLLFGFETWNGPTAAAEPTGDAPAAAPATAPAPASAQDGNVYNAMPDENEPAPIYEIYSREVRVPGVDQKLVCGSFFVTAMLMNLSDFQQTFFSNFSGIPRSTVFPFFSCLSVVYCSCLIRLVKKTPNLTANCPTFWTLPASATPFAVWMYVFFFDDFSPLVF